MFNTANKTTSPEKGDRPPAIQIGDGGPIQHDMDISNAAAIEPWIRPDGARQQEEDMDSDMIDIPITTGPAAIEKPQDPAPPHTGPIPGFLPEPIPEGATIRGPDHGGKRTGIGGSHRKGFKRMWPG